MIDLPFNVFQLICTIWSVILNFQLIGNWDRSFSAGRNISSKLAQVG